MLAAGFRGLYLDANAIAPQRVRAMSEAVAAAGASFVDGSIIGGPAWTPGATRLYLAGTRAGEAAACFAAGNFDVRLLGDEIGRASALKMCYVAYGKGSTPLLAAILAAAEQMGVRAELEEKWGSDDPKFPGQAAGRVQGSARKAWRFAGEMEEIAATLEAASGTGQLHLSL